MASHIGLIIDVPTIGVAKRLLTGDIKEDKIYIDNELRGKLVRTKEHSKPLIVSVGHKISLKTAMSIVEEAIKLPHKLPEPLHQAHRYANKIRKEEIKEI
jgi:deoxyribonuclease V